MAEFTTNQLNGALIFLFGSKTTARIIKIFPSILVIVKTMDKLVVMKDNSVGARVARHRFSNAVTCLNSVRKTNEGIVLC